MEDLTSISLDSLLGEEVVYFLRDKLRRMRGCSGHGTLELRVQDGYILTYSEKTVYKASGRTRYRTKAN